MLRIDGLSKSFGGLQVVSELTLSVGEGEIVGLIGPNGAGKTTVFNLVAGSLRADAGEMHFEDERITRWAVHKVAAIGLVRTFQIPRLFEDLSVIENLMAAIPRQRGEKFWNVWTQPSSVAREETTNERRSWEVLEFLNLGSVANSGAGAISGGQKKLVELGRALMAEPKMLLLDEPVAGVSPILAELIAERIRTLRKRGHTFLVIEHNMDFMMGLADRLYVMTEGRILREGTPVAIRTDPAVLDAYLGGGE